MNMEQRRQYVHRLEEHVRQYLLKLEQMLGPRDGRFVFGEVRRSIRDRGNPHIHFPDGYHLKENCTVDIHIGKRPWDNMWQDQSTWQVAHECVHLLEPGKRLDTIILEEGLATWFQDELKFHNKKLWPYIEKSRKVLPPSYVEARKLVLECKPESHLCPAVKQIRASGVRIRNIEGVLLESHLPHASDDTIERLCAPFYGA